MTVSLALAAGLLGLASMPTNVAPRQRFALVAGANHGGAGRPHLKYAVSDARRFAHVLRELGGVAPADALVLEEPGPGDLERGLELLRGRVAAAREAAGENARTEVVVFYSGHADATGLLLGGRRFPYRTLRDRLDAIPADLRIAVLDACASGAITRLKGGQPRPPFVVDASTNMRGHAFLTSSAAEEAAQESDRIGASYFTHYLISGLRGAADASGEGAVTLGEAYQFAFRETLGRTAETRGGPQHPTYDINLTGTGDVVMTDLRRTSAGLVLAEDLAGRCFVRDAAQSLVVELLKPRDRRVELGLAPGRYEVLCQDPQSALVSRPVLQEGKRVVLGASDFSPGRRDRTLARGGDGPATRNLDRRHRLDVRFGRWPDQPRLEYFRWVRPSLAIGVGAALGEEDATVFTDAAFFNDVSDIFSTVVSVRWDLHGGASAPRLRPYLTAGAGLWSRSAVLSRRDSARRTEGGDVIESTTWVSESYEISKAGGRLGLGLDVRLGRRFMLGARAECDAVPAFATRLVGRRHYGGLGAGVALGWQFGKGRPAGPLLQR